MSRKEVPVLVKGEMPCIIFDEKDQVIEPKNASGSLAQHFAFIFKHTLSLIGGGGRTLQHFINETSSKDPKVEQVELAQAIKRLPPQHAPSLIAGQSRKVGVSNFFHQYSSLGLEFENDAVFRGVTKAFDNVLLGHKDIKKDDPAFQNLGRFLLEIATEYHKAVGAFNLAQCNILANAALKKMKIPGVGRVEVSFLGFKEKFDKNSQVQLSPDCRRALDDVMKTEFFTTTSEKRKNVRFFLKRAKVQIQNNNELEKLIKRVDEIIKKLKDRKINAALWESKTKNKLIKLLTKIDPHLTLKDPRATDLREMLAIEDFYQKNKNYFPLEELSRFLLARAVIKSAFAEKVYLALNFLVAAIDDKLFAFSAAFKAISGEKGIIKFSDKLKTKIGSSYVALDDKENFLAALSKPMPEQKLIKGRNYRLVVPDLAKLDHDLSLLESKPILWGETPEKRHEAFQVKATEIIGNKKEFFKLFFESMQNKSYSQALRRLCTLNSPEAHAVLEELLKSELPFNINEKAGEKDYTALHHAAIKANQKAYDLLLAHAKIDPSVEDKLGHKAEHYLKPLFLENTI